MIQFAWVTGTRITREPTHINSYASVCLNRAMDTEARASSM